MHSPSGRQVYLDGIPLKGRASVQREQGLKLVEVTCWSSWRRLGFSLGVLSFGLVWLTMSELARLHRLGALVMDVMARVLEVEYGPQSPMFEPIEIPCCWVL